MRIVIPENLGGDLVVIPSDSYEAEIQDIFLGESASKNPKATVKYIVLTEYTGKKLPEGIETTVGCVLLESFSLQPQAVWKLNGLWKDVKGENLPQGDFSKEEFEAMLKEELIGKAFTLLVDVKDNPNSGEKMNEVVQRKLIQRGRGAKKAKK